MLKISAFSDEAGEALSLQIAALERNGITMTELRSVGGKNVLDLTEEEAKEIAATLGAAGIGVSAIGSPLGKVDIEGLDFEAYLGKVHHACKLAQIFSTDRIRMFSFFGAYDKPQLVADYLRQMVAVAREYGVTLCHENEKKVFGDTTQRVLWLHDNVEGLGFVYDPANYLQCGERAAVTLPAALPISTYCHIKDVVFETGELVPAGEGDGEIATMLAMLKTFAGDTVLTLEPHLRVFESYAKIDGEEMHHRHHFESADAAFDAAVTALKGLLVAAGYRETLKGVFEK